MLFAEQEIDVKLLKAFNPKLSCNMLVHSELLQELSIIEFESFESIVKVFESYMTNVTFGFELIDAHTIGMVLLVKSFIKFIV